MSHVSSTQQPYGASGSLSGQHGYRTFPSWQEALLDRAGRKQHPILHIRKLNEGAIYNGVGRELYPPKSLSFLPLISY